MAIGIIRNLGSEEGSGGSYTPPSFEVVYSYTSDGAADAGTAKTLTYQFQEKGDYVIVANCIAYSSTATPTVTNSGSTPTVLYSDLRSYYDKDTSGNYIADSSSLIVSKISGAVGDTVTVDFTATDTFNTFFLQIIKAKSSSVSYINGAYTSRISAGTVTQTVTSNTAGCLLIVTAMNGLWGDPTVAGSSSTSVSTLLNQSNKNSSANQWGGRLKTFITDTLNANTEVFTTTYVSSTTTVEKSSLRTVAFRVV